MWPAALLLWAALTALLLAVAAAALLAVTRPTLKTTTRLGQSSSSGQTGPRLRLSADLLRPTANPFSSLDRRESMPEMQARVRRTSAPPAAPAGGRRGTWSEIVSPPGSAAPPPGYRQYVNSLDAVLAARSRVVGTGAGAWGSALALAPPGAEQDPGASETDRRSARVQETLALLLAGRVPGRGSDPTGFAAPGCERGGPPSQGAFCGGPGEPRLARLSGCSSRSSRSAADFLAFTQVTFIHGHCP